jgi:5-methylcytosine-specific restriction endonuclease McrA
MPRQPHRAARHRGAVIERDGTSCYYCGRPKLSGRTATLDHVVPLRHGGADSLDNLVLSCPRCNAQKQSSRLEDYITRRLLALKREKDRLALVAKLHNLV